MDPPYWSLNDRWITRVWSNFTYMVDMFYFLSSTWLLLYLITWAVLLRFILYFNPILHLKLLSPFSQASSPLSYWAIRHLSGSFFLSLLWISIGRSNINNVDDYGIWKIQWMILGNSYRKTLLNSHIWVAPSVLLYFSNAFNILYGQLMCVWLDIWIS